jgi:hypothetical protein
MNNATVPIELAEAPTIVEATGVSIKEKAGWMVKLEGRRLLQ